MGFFARNSNERMEAGHVFVFFPAPWLKAGTPIPTDNVRCYRLVRSQNLPQAMEMHSKAMLKLVIFF